MSKTCSHVEKSLLTSTHSHNQCDADNRHGWKTRDVLAPPSIALGLPTSIATDPVYQSISDALQNGCVNMEMEENVVYGMVES